MLLLQCTFRIMFGIFLSLKNLKCACRGFSSSICPKFTKICLFLFILHLYPAFPENALALWDLKGFLEWCKQRKVFAVYSRHRFIKGTIEDLWWSFYAKINHEFKRLLYEIRLCSISKSFNRSCRSSIFYKKTVLKNFIIFTKKRLQHMCFSVNNA